MEKKKQNIALSTCEAESMPLTDAIQDRIFLCQLLSDMRGSDMDESENSATIYG